LWLGSEGILTGGAAVATRGGCVIWRGAAANLPPQLLQAMERAPTDADGLPRHRRFGADAILAPGLIDLHCHCDPTEGPG
jgi:hypothetical protein